MLEAELMLDAKVLLGEGPWWNAATQQLYWVDIEGCALHVFDPATRADRKIEVGQMVGAVVGGKPGSVVLALQHGFHSLDLETERLTLLVDPEADLPENRFNDGKCDSRGRFWAGTTRINHDEQVGSLYRLDADLTVHRELSDVWISNGLAWTSDDRTMFFIDSPTRQIVAFDFDAEAGSLSNKRLVIEIPEGDGFPDGMTIDEEGMLWIALWDGWRVIRVNPAAGAIINEIRLPVARPTSCVFGGANLDELYITSASTRMPAEELAKQPLAGGLFHCQPGVRGLPMTAFAG
ncbi:MAG TPA: SMP-30/gluconolactonase/LRE family protein [Blastocatellia bacterium]|nr:SMP-30/gluconolactonase/LRE family protein [Blastocatellia bacterium]HMX25250.1 SMP-30/gluconolactonase/LRE family protein [Blastocatellia bacterium]HMY72272.1 SMP-30/gluconolactonase/LRE family protein [Blastocatellia bacterium]HMZ22872.1 SMP-30/gluconolactonase/LRE family protein [Blastocatellia bacterium]HNG30008.1 SMP-30/gluconolactonase/LRE family protein [Blastocatellia bacterium]